MAAYAGDPGNAPEWYANIKDVQWTSEPPLRVGSRLAFRSGVAGLVMAPMMRRAMRKDLARLKAILEAR